MPQRSANEIQKLQRSDRLNLLAKVLLHTFPGRQKCEKTVVFKHCGFQEAQIVLMLHLLFATALQIIKHCNA